MSIVSQGFGSLATGGVFSYNIGEIKIDTQEVIVVSDAQVDIKLQLICE